MRFYLFPICSLVITTTCVVVVADDSTLVIPSNRTRTPIGLLFIPGAQIGADQYLRLGSKIQDDSEYSLWLTTIGKWIGMVNPLQMPSLIDDAVKTMHNAGLPKDAPIFVAAHSLGGVFLDMYVRANSSMTSGIILYGAYKNKGVKLEDYPVPVLTIAGDQDGMCRMTRIAKDFGQLKRYSPRTPVVIVPGVNHSQIASGKMPKLVEDNDLIADLTEEEAHKLLSRITNAFLTLNGPKLSPSSVQAANSILNSSFISTGYVAEPFLTVLQMDSGGFASPAQGTATILTDMTTSQVQMNVYGWNVDDIKLMTNAPKFSKVNDTTFDMMVPFHNDMPLNPMDISLVPQSPTQMLLKTITKSEVRRQFPKAEYSDIPRHCNDTIFIALELVLLFIPYNYVARYNTKGMQLEFAADRVMKIESDWLLTNIAWDYSREKKAVVSVPYYGDSNVIMCKVLTMSRLMEWIYIDSFKKQHT